MDQIKMDQSIDILKLLKPCHLKKNTICLSVPEQCIYNSFTMILHAYWFKFDIQIIGPVAEGPKDVWPRGLDNLITVFVVLWG